MASFFISFIFSTFVVNNIFIYTVNKIIPQMTYSGNTTQTKIDKIKDRESKVVVNDKIRKISKHNKERWCVK